MFWTFHPRDEGDQSKWSVTRVLSVCFHGCFNNTHSGSLTYTSCWRSCECREGTQKLISFQRLKLSNLQRLANLILSYERVKGRGFWHFSIPHSVCTCTSTAYGQCVLISEKLSCCFSPKRVIISFDSRGSKEKTSGFKRWRQFELRLKNLCCPHTHAHAHMLKHRLTHAYTHRHMHSRAQTHT